MKNHPIEQFAEWFKEAQKSKEPLPESMSVATVDSDGNPSLRILLLKDFSEKGFVFYTNYESRKSSDLRENPRIALTFHWPSLERQIRIEGKAKKVSRQESQDYFKTRPYGSQLGAWASPQSTAISGRDYLDERVEVFQQKFRGKKIPCPPHWGGYCVTPQRIEFWQGQPSRLHDRYLYLKSGRHWKLIRLAP